MAILSVEHVPCGDEHPYEKGPLERSPREPQAGQPVRLGAATSPPGVAQTLGVTWTVEGTQLVGEAQGRQVREDGERSYWEVALPSFPGGARVSYHLWARGQGAQAAAGPFTFSVSQWCEVGEVLGANLSPESLVLECATVGAPGRTRVTLELRGEGWLHVTLAFAHGGGRQRAAERNPGEGLNERPGRRDAQPQEGDDSFQVDLGPFRLKIGGSPCRLEIGRRDGAAVLKEVRPAAWRLGADGRALELCQTFAAPAEEAFYGFGERFNALDQRGHELDVRVFDQYKKQGLRTYLPVPFFLSSRGYGLYLNTAHPVVYDMAASRGDRWSYRAGLGEEAALEYDLFVRDSARAILADFTRLTGKPSLPPVWAFGPWMSGNEWNTQARVMEQVAETLRHEIPVTVLVIEAWSDESTFYIWNDARYSPKPPQEPFKYADFEFPCQGKWPDPKGMIETLHRLGIRVLLWQIPVMKALEAPHPQHDADEAYMIAQGFCVGEQNGEPYRVRPPWFKGGVVLDFSHPRAAAWWLSKRAYLLEELGVDGFKTDGGEHLWGEGVRLFDGSRGATAANRYPNYYVGAYHAFARQKRAGQAITFSRAGFTGCQAYPCHWAGDEDSTWEAFRASILAGLNAGISGIPFWGWDLAGFSGEIPTAELYLRATAMAAFCPIMQYHSEFNDHRSPCRDRTPWNIQARSGDSQVIPVFRHFANLRMNLLPYLYSEAWKSNRSGVPLMRAMPIEVPADPAVRDFPYQYLLGEALLVAPVVEEGVSSWPVYLPSGWWFDLWTGKGFHGPRVVHCAVPRDIIPVFLRADALLALNLGDEFSLGDAVGNGVTAYRNLCFRVHPRRAARHTWFDMLRAEPVSIEQRPVPGHGGVEFTVERMRHPYTLIIPGLPPRGVKVNGRDLRAAAGPGAALAREGGGWVYDEGKGAALIGVDSHARQRKIEVLGPREA